MNEDTETRKNITEHLPLTEATFFILLSLIGGKKHGYAIMKDVAQLSDERITLGTGTLYGALGRLLDQGWIDRVDEERVTGRPRKAYELSDLGRRILAAETERLRSLMEAAQLRLAGNVA
jgi:DNA-binding PadR family transcriptional regulator